MQSTEIYEFSDYRSYLRSLIAAAEGTWGYQTKLAAAARCQKSYFSQVLRGAASLSPDQAAALGTFLALDADAFAYFLDLVAHDRAATKELKTWLEDRLAAARAKRDHLAKRFAVPAPMSTSQEQLYYSTWYCAALHVLAGSPPNNTEAAMAAKLGLPLQLVRDTLALLAGMDLVIRGAPGTWQMTTKAIHLPRESPLSPTHHFQWRQQANLHIQTRQPSSLHYTSVQSVAKSDVPRIRAAIVQAIADIRRQVAESGTEELTCFLVDFFPVGNEG